MVERRKTVLDLFTEIAKVEHLVRNHVETISSMGLTAGEFGTLNYFVRNDRETERRSVLAWLFQVSIETTEAHLAALERRGFIGRIGAGDDQLIGITAAGRAAHVDSLAGMAPEIEPLMSEFEDEDLEKALGVLRDIRRVFDNLPERLAS